MPPRAGPLAALLCLPAAAALAADPAPAAPPSGAAAPAQAERSADAVLDEITGTVQTVDRQRQVVTIATAGAAVDVRLDRNTLVYQPGGATTVLAIQPGAFVRSGVDAARRAFWIQLRPPAAATEAAPPAAPAAPSAEPSAAGKQP